MYFKPENLRIDDSLGWLSDKSAYVGDTICESVNLAQQQMGVDFSNLLVVVKTSSVNSLEEWAIGAGTHYASAIHFFVNPKNKSFHDQRLGSRLRSQTIHECHHIARMRANCWEEAFGDDLVLEGMAAAFEIETAKSSDKKIAEPFFFTHSLSGEKLSEAEDRAIQMLDKVDYDHYDFKDWFIGYKGHPEFPPLMGHSLGLAITTQWLKAAGLTAAKAHNVQTSTIIDWWRARHEAGYRLGANARNEYEAIKAARPKGGDALKLTGRVSGNRQLAA